MYPIHIYRIASCMYVRPAIRLRSIMSVGWIGPRVTRVLSISISFVHQLRYEDWLKSTGANSV